MDAWTSGISAAVTLAVLGGILKLARRDAPIVEGAVVLRYPLALRILLWFAGGLFFGAAVAVGVAVALGAADAKLQRVAWLFVPMGLLLGPAGLLEPRVCLQLDGDGIRGRTAWRGRRAIAWSEIAEVRWSTLNNAFVLRARNGAKLSVSRFLQGHEAVVAALEAKVPEPLWRRAVDRYARSKLRT